MQSTGNQPGSSSVMSDVNDQHVDKVEFKVPPFSPDRPALWFNILELQFVAARVTTEHTKLVKLTSSLTIRELSEVSDFFDNPPERNPYTVLKNLLIERLTESRSQQIQQLLYKQELGDRKPSMYLRELRRLNNRAVNDEVLRNIWMNNLPRDVQRVIVGTRAPLDEVAVQADAIVEVSGVRRVDAVAECSGTKNGSSTEGGTIEQLQSQISELTRIVSGMRSVPSRNRGSWSRNPSPHPRGSYSRRRSTSRDPPRMDYCYYHQRYGPDAINCRQPCAFKRRGTKSTGNGYNGQ